MAAEIVVLGGGVGGTLTANLLARRLKNGRARVRLVDTTGLNVYQPGFLYLALGQVNGGWLSRDLRSLLDDRVELLIDRAVGIDAAAGKVELAREGTIGYDQLVLSTGAHLDHDAVPGLRAGSHGFYSMVDAERLREALRTFPGGRLVIGVAGMPYKCPPAPVEFALLVEEYLRKRRRRSQTTIDFLSPLNRAFTIESASQLVQPIFEERGIELHTFVNVETVDPEAKELTSLEGETFSYDLAVLIPPHKGADVVTDSGFGEMGGWVPVDRETLRVQGQDNIYAIGDATNLPISKSGSTAHFEAPVVTEHITAAVTGRPPCPQRSRYGGKVTCFLETGNRQATILVFDYDHPPRPPKPSVVWHAAKWAFNRAYWWTVPRGRF
ncbi:MAG: NAD(P)/FAD-dependent oxidoreductase [Acidimicrobiia bacterium]